MTDIPRQAPRSPVIAPAKAIMEGRGAEEFEREIKALFDKGHREVIVNLIAVPYMDSGGLRGLVRGHTTARKVGGHFRVVAPSPRVRALLATTRLDQALDISDSFEALRARPKGD